MRFAIVVFVLAALSAAAPTLDLDIEARAKPDIKQRSSSSDLIQLLVSLLSGLRGGRGIRGGHPTIPFPFGTTTVAATTLPATTVAATTLPATTIGATTIGSTVLSPTTVPATTLAATTVAASTVAATTVVVDPVQTSTAAADSTSAAASATSTGNLDCVVAPESLPAAATEGTAALPTPTGTFVGSFTGVGTQNYDCGSGNATATPSSIGANADLSGTCGSGVHSFDNPTTPRFNMSQLGDTTAQKLASMTSPDGTTNVAWLNLKVLTTTGGIVQIYRVNTQGGVAPTVCGIETGTVRVDYQAKYFFYQTT